MVLVLIVSLFSLTVLAVITGVYFSTNFKSMRSDRLEVIAQMKASQVQQSLNYLYYQAYWLGVKDSIQTSLVSYRAGNISESNWEAAKESIMQFLSSSNTFTNVKLYDSKFVNVVTSEQNWSNLVVSDDVLDDLYPLDHINDPNATNIPASLEQQGVLTGPLLNDTDYVMSMTIPIYASASIILESQDLAGYFTVVMTAQSLSSVLYLDEASVVLVQPLYVNLNSSNSTYGYVIAPQDRDVSSLYDVFLMKDSYPATQVLRYLRSGSRASVRSETGKTVAVGYCPVDLNLTHWGVIIEQPIAVFLEPSNHLRSILLGVCFGTAALIVLCTFPLAHWATQPILRLQKATETIAMGRGLQQPRDPKDPSSGYSSNRHSFTASISPYNNTTEMPDSTQVTSPITSSNGSSNNGHQPRYIGNARVPKYTRFFQDELSKLTETFNTMTDELDKQYSQLEDRVRARTKQLEAAKIQAEAADEAKTVFIANISHELRTPLNGILGMTAISMAENDQTKIQQSLKLIFRSGELLLHILTELLTFSKNSLKRSKLEKSDFSPTEVALQIKSIFGKLARDQNVNLQINIEPNDVRNMVIYGDSNRIIQVVMNLVSNALKFTPVDGKVKMTIKRIGEYDEEKSKQCDYTEVYHKSGEPEHTYPTDARITDETKNTDEKETKYESTSSNTTSTKYEDGDNENDNMDAKSIVTVSTTSFDDNVFKAQFKSPELSESNDPENVEKLKHPKTFVFEFIVEDTGPGIAPKLQSTVFEPFVQGDQTLSRQYGGTGLGLSICRQLAGMMQGVMRLESEVGVGSKFTFRVPLQQTAVLLVDENDPNLYDDQFNVDSRKNRKVHILDPKSDESIDDLNKIATINNEAHDEIVEDENDHLPEMAETRAIDESEPIEKRISLSSKSMSSKDEGYFTRPVVSSTGTAKSSIHSYYSSKSIPDLNYIHLTILVAEDNSVNQEVIKRMLSLEGFKDIEIAIDGIEAVEQVKAHFGTKTEDGKIDQYDIIFMDVQMPKLDGLQATKEIRRLGYEGPIVALTAFADESNVKECLDAGMSGFLGKPIRRPQLRSVLAKFFPGVRVPSVSTPVE